MTYLGNVTYDCTFIDNPITLNGNPNLADVLEFSNYSSINQYDFLYRYTKEVDGIKNKDLFKKIYCEISDLNVLLIESSYYTTFDIKNLKKVGVMTLEDSWLDEKNCTLKRIGSSCEEEEMAEFDTIPSELGNKGCEKIFFNIYDLFYTCDYNDSISVSGYSGPIKNSTSTSTSSSKSSTKETDTTIFILVSEKNLFNSKSFVILSIGISVLIILAVFPLVHYYLVTKSKLKVEKKSDSSSGISDYTLSTNDTSSSEISDKNSSDSNSN
jgi:hypothetical protein